MVYIILKFIPRYFKIFVAAVNGIFAFVVMNNVGRL